MEYGNICLIWTGFDKLMFNSTEDLLQYRSLPRALKEFEYDMRISGMDTDDEY